MHRNKKPIIVKLKEKGFSFQLPQILSLLCLMKEVSERESDEGLSFFWSMHLTVLLRGISRETAQSGFFCAG